MYKGKVYLIEFKVGEKSYRRHNINQVMDYALDLKYFHQESYSAELVSGL